MTVRRDPSLWIAFAVGIFVLLMAIATVVTIEGRFVATTPPVVIIQDLPSADDLTNLSIDDWWVLGKPPRPFTAKPLVVFPRNSVVALRGWALSPKPGPDDAVFGIIDDKTYFHGDGGLLRPDVAAALHRSDAGTSGFELVFGTANLQGGPHTLRIAVASPIAQTVHRSQSIRFLVR